MTFDVIIYTYFTYKMSKLYKYVWSSESQFGKIYITIVTIDEKIARQNIIDKFDVYKKNYKKIHQLFSTSNNRYKKHCEICKFLDIETSPMFNFFKKYIDLMNELNLLHDELIIYDMITDNMKHQKKFIQFINNHPNSFPIIGSLKDYTKKEIDDYIISLRKSPAIIPKNMMPLDNSTAHYIIDHW